MTTISICITVYVMMQGALLYMLIKPGKRQPKRKASYIMMMKPTFLKKTVSLKNEAEQNG